MRMRMRVRIRLGGRRRGEPGGRAEPQTSLQLAGHGQAASTCARHIHAYPHAQALGALGSLLASLCKAAPPQSLRWAAGREGAASPNAAAAQRGLAEAEGLPLAMALRGAREGHQGRLAGEAAGQGGDGGTSCSTEEDPTVTGSLTGLGHQTGDEDTGRGTERERGREKEKKTARERENVK